MKRHSFIYLLLATIWLVSGCQADSATVTPTEAKTIIPSATATIEPASTDIPISSLPIEEISEKILTGEEIDVSFMSDEQKAALGLDLANRFLADQTIDLSAL